MGNKEKLQEGLKNGLKKLNLPASVETPEGSTMPAAANRDPAFRLTGLLTAIVALLVLVFGGMLGLQLYKSLGMGDNGAKNLPMVYLRENGTLRYINQLMESPATIATGVELARRDAHSDQQAFMLSENGRQLLYMQQLGGDYGQLWLTTLPWTMEPDQEELNPGILLADQVLVGSAQFLPDGGVLYQRTDGGDRTHTNLCRWTKKGGEEVLDIYLTDRVQLLEGGRLAYTKKLEGATLQITVMELPKKVGQLPIIHVVEDGDVIIQKVDSTTLYYTTKTGTTMSLWRWDGVGSTLLAEEVSSILDIGPKGEVLFIRQTTQRFDPAPFFEDDLALEDRALTQPDREDFYVETKNLWGKVTRSFDQKAYDAAEVAYAQKQLRDEIRVAITQQHRSYLSYVLCHTTGSSSTVVDTAIRAVVAGDAASGSAVYYKERSTIAEKFRISAITDPQEVQKLVDTVQNNTVRDYYYAQLGTEPALFQSLSASVEQMELLLDGGKGLYLLRSTQEQPLDEMGGTLYYAAVEQGELGGAKKVDDRVLALPKQRYQDQRLYQKLAGSEKVDLYGVEAGKKTQLFTGLSQKAGVFVHDDVLMGYSDYHTGRQVGTLLLDKKRQRTVGEGVHDYSYRTPGYIYVLNNYDSVTGTGDLWLYTGNPKKLKFIDSGVAIMTMGLGYRLQD